MINIDGLINRKVQFQKGERKGQYGQIVGGFFQEVELNSFYLIVCMQGDDAGELVCTGYSSVRLKN